MKNFTVNRLQEILGRSRNEQRGMRIRVMVNGMKAYVTGAETDVVNNELVLDAEVEEKTGGEKMDEAGKAYGSASDHMFKS